MFRSRPTRAPSAPWPRGQIAARWPGTRADPRSVRNPLDVGALLLRKKFFGVELGHVRLAVEQLQLDIGARQHGELPRIELAVGRIGVDHAVVGAVQN